MKVAIVGAGISGLYLAWKLAGRGGDVTILEKKKEIGKKVCSGLFSRKITDFIPGSNNLVKNKIEFVLIHFPERTIRVDFSETFFVMEHVELDKLTASLAERSGAKIILDSLVESMPEGFDRIIGCDGALSVIRKHLKGDNPDFRLAIQGFCQKKDFSNYVETWPTKNGFIWKIPRGENVEYGIIDSPADCKSALEEFSGRNGLALEGMKAATIPQGFFIPKNETITLCGDAAGLTKPWSGGGVIWSLFACDILLKNFPNFIKYQKEAERAFRLKIVFSKAITNLVYFFGFNFPWLLPKNFKIDGDFLSLFKKA